MLSANYKAFWSSFNTVISCRKKLLVGNQIYTIFVTPRGLRKKNKNIFYSDIQWRFVYVIIMKILSV